ncbi:hypothetical protein HU200_034695 [Digitaria exilis]|uniref:Uncharacterized protein n=1 Tax=Digitaria exilis TaxID=1010633 RepID=A0A835EJM9_9POAL|nr:hypothetical protein HU200_034695 [Digitaria exilis]
MATHLLTTTLRTYPRFTWFFACWPAAAAMPTTSSPI